MDHNVYRADLCFLRAAVFRLLISGSCLAAWHWLDSHQDAFKPGSDENFLISFGLVSGHYFFPAAALGVLFGRWGFLVAVGIVGLYLAYLFGALFLLGGT